LYHDKSLRIGKNTFWRSASGQQTWYGKAVSTTAKVVGTVAGAFVGGPAGAAAGAALATAATEGSKYKSSKEAGVGSKYTGGFERQADADPGKLATKIGIAAIEGYMGGQNIQGFAQGATAASQAGIKTSGGITKVATESGKKLGGFGFQGQNLGSRLAGETITSQVGLQGGESLVGQAIATNAQQQMIDQGVYKSAESIGNKLFGDKGYSQIMDRLAQGGGKLDNFMNTLTQGQGDIGNQLFNQLGNKLFKSEDDDQNTEFNNILNLIRQFR